MTGPGTLLTLDVERPAAGGRMLARHDGQVVLVWGAIPGERVRARVERAGRGVLFADTVDVVSPSDDRRSEGYDRTCGGNVLAHIDYPRQLALKAEVVADAFARIGRLRLPSAPEIAGSPERGYRMRARLHVRGGRIGFYREGTHELCPPGATGQLRGETCEWLEHVGEVLGRDRLSGLAGLELAENIAGDERACHLDLRAGAEPARFAALASGLVGLSAGLADSREDEVIAGVPAVRDVLHVREGDRSSALRLRRGVRAFFQANRFLLEPLVRHVVSLAGPGPVVDLYAGVGLFGLSLAAAGCDHVTLVEEDPAGGRDLQDNAEPFGRRVRVERRRVEAFLARGPSPAGGSATVIVDPPRTGVSRQACAGLVRWKPRRVVYVSCDAATLARDGRALADGGYELTAVSGMDLFPNTAHVEIVAVFDVVGRPSSAAAAL
jgi:23S rRNA (uracil1939-C5)-methyltransferase